MKIDKYLREATNNKEEMLLEFTNISEDKAFKSMSSYLKNLKMKISKAESSIKKGQIDLNVVDLFMRMSKVNDEDFFEYFWS